MEKPILFNTEMVKAILEGRKISTRRVVKQKYENTDIELFTNKYGTRLVEMQNDVPAPVYDSETNTTKHKMKACEEIKKPYQIGDILWVRETWLKADDGYHYKSDETISSKETRESYGYKWKPSIHMPKDAARTFLKVTDVRAERLQDITELNAKQEGCFLPSYKDGVLIGDSVTLFKIIWDNIYKNWNENPWVWVIEFEIVEG